jgi:hypothetical protein
MVTDKIQTSSIRGRSNTMTKMDTINDLITQLNKLRVSQHKPVVVRAWTGLGHWLKTNEENYHSVGGIFTKDDEFIGFLEGLLYTE